MNINEISNEDALKWVYFKWHELHESLCDKKITSIEYCHRRKSYEGIMWELRHLMGEKVYMDFNKYFNELD